MSASVSIHPEKRWSIYQHLDFELPSFLSGASEDSGPAIDRINELIDKLGLSHMYGTVDSFLGWDEPAVDDGSGIDDDDSTQQDVRPLEWVRVDKMASLYRKWCRDNNLVIDSSVEGALMEADDAIEALKGVKIVIEGRYVDP